VAKKGLKLQMRRIVSRENMRFVEVAGRIWINSPIKAEQPHHLFGTEMAISGRCRLHLEEDLVYDVGFLGYAVLGKGGRASSFPPDVQSNIRAAPVISFFSRFFF